MPETKQTKALSLVHRVRERLSRFPLDITHREFPMRHTVTDASLAAASVWLSARL
jgi:predicted esterase